MSRFFIFLFLIFISIIYLTDSSEPYTQYAAQYNNHINAANSEEYRAQNVVGIARSNAISFYIYLKNKFLYNSKENDDQVENYREFKRKLAEDLSLFDYTTFNNEGLKRQIKRLSKLQLEGLSSDDYKRAIDTLKSLQSLSTEPNIPPITSSGKRLRYQIEGLEKIRTEFDQETLLYIWKEWRSAIAKNARENLIKYKEYYRKAATLNGHVTPSKTWYLYYEDNNMLDELTKFMEGIKPLYQQLHAYIRHSIRNEYGDVPFDGPIPHHLLEQVMEQEWHKKSSFRIPHNNYQLPDVNGAFRDKMVNHQKMFENAVKFYEEGLGLQPFEDSKKQYFMPLYTNDTDCKAIVEKFPPDYGIKYCAGVNYKRYLQLLQAIAKLKYYQHIVNLPLGLDEEACPGFGDAIGEAAVIAAGSPRYIDKILGLQKDSYTPQLQLNRLFRMAVHTLFSVTQYFIHEKFWADFLDGKITEENMNCEFWRLQEEWAGSIPPEDRDESTFDASYKFYRGISDDTSSTRSLVSEILGYQFYKTFCKEQLRDNQDYTLSNCDIYDNKRVGLAMTQMMSKGFIQHWHDVMEILTQTRGLDASAMLEYYAPLNDWLTNENKRHAIHVGWDIEMDECDN